MRRQVFGWAFVCTLACVGTSAHAIEILTMEPYLGSAYDAIWGLDHTSFAETDVTPDRFEFWKGSNLLGTTYPASSSGTTTTFA